ncbi:MAG: beta-propeller fold lactonase family protein [Bacilli bacterium]|nr:beta-propeller fold lactonase family protein [Bacilli bacterium]
MRLIVSGYGENEECLNLVEVDLKNKYVNFLDGAILNQASYVISYTEDKTYVVTYTKNPLKLVSYYIDGNKLTFIDEISVPYLSLTHLLYNKKEKILFGCSYKDGMYLKCSLNKGYFSNLITKENKKPSLCHCVILAPVTDEVCIIDIKNDKINIYSYDLDYKRSISMPKGVGPRHGIYHEGKLYVITEYSNEIYVIDYASGKTLSSASTLTYNVKSYGATLFILNNKLYASNRGEESIAVFDIVGDKVVLNHSFPCYGAHPRHMVLTSDNKYIISCNKDSNTVAIIDIETEECVLLFDYYMPSGIAELV